MKERIWFKLAWLLPRKLVYFATIRLVAHASRVHGDMEVPAIPAMTALAAWEKT